MSELRVGTRVIDNRDYMILSTRLRSAVIAVQAWACGGVGVASALVTDLFLLPAIVAFIFGKYPSGTKEHISQNMLGQPGKSTHLSRAPVRKQKIANR